VPKFAANLSFIFQEVGFLERFAAAATCGFKAVEYLSPYDHPPGQDRAQAERTYLANLRHAADRLAAEGVMLVIEPINTRDIPGYFLNTTTQAMSVIERVGHANLKLQLDLYHVQIMEGDLAHRVRALAGQYPHVQIAGNPGRHEPDIGEINYPFLFDLLDELGYSGWIGCEYRPKGETKTGLSWAKRYGIGG